MAGYKVVGHCAHVTTMTESGKRKIMLFRGNPLPADVPGREIRHLLSVKLIAPTGTAEPEPVAPAVVTAPDGSSSNRPPAGQDSVAFDDPERVKAREKLPADGAAPDKRAAEATWVEYAVSKGYSYDEAKAAGKAELVTLFTG